MTSEIPSFQSDIEEGVQVTINEVPDAPEYSIKELFYTLKTFASNDASAVTDFINGELQAMIISSDKSVWIQIYSADNDFMIYEKKDFNGTYYLPIRITPVSKSGQQFNFNAEKFQLNEPLNIIIKGQLDTTVSIKIRYCEE
jgi:hypothetical protein